MDGSSEEMYLQNLEEFVLDEDKIVTYKWLSKTLNIHVNQSKQLLYTFCSGKKQRELVSATYLLAGRLQSTGKSHITVVGQDKYEDAKSSFESLSSEHVYSVQKSKKSPSPSTLYTADSQLVEEKNDGSTSLGAIRCKESVRRAAEEMALLRITVPPTPISNASSKPPPPAKPTLSKSPEKSSPVKSNNKNGKESANKDSKAKGGLAAMFAAQTSKASTKAGAASTTSTTKNNSNSKKGGGISNFFTKVSKEDLPENDRKENQEANNSDGVIKDEPMDIVNDGAVCESPSPVKEERKTDPDLKKKPTPKASQQNKQKRTRKKEKKEDGKKRRRIVAPDLESSDEDDMFAEEGNATSRESSPLPVLQAKALESDEEEEIIQPTPTAESSNGRRRRKRKVTKDKTFMDDDGYIVTQKVTEYESYSESDTENTETKKMKEPATTIVYDNDKEPASSTKTKIEKAKAAPKKTSPPSKNKSPVKNKQQSLMSFFKKKE